jgi:hypothetical protein
LRKETELRRRLLPLACFFAFAALVLVACGSGTSEESKVEEVIETAAASNNPADCKKLQTQGFTEQASHESGGGAVARCEEEAEEGEGVKAATVSSVRVNGSRAKAKVALKGGTLDGQVVEVALVKSGDQWKLDEIVGFTGFDEPKLIENLERELERSSGEVSAKFATCFVESFDEGGKGEVEELLLTPAAEEVEGVAKRCA